MMRDTLACHPTTHATGVELSAPRFTLLHMDVSSLTQKLDDTAATLDTITGELEARRNHVGGNAWIEARMTELINASDQISETQAKMVELIEVTHG